MKVNVVAPSDLLEGYELDVSTADGKPTRVVIPRNVQKGDVVECDEVPVITFQDVESAVPDTTTTSAVKTKTGKQGDFKTGICGCVGICCSALWWNAALCFCIPMAQLVFRLKLDWNGAPTLDRQRLQRTFGIVIAVVIVYRIALCAFVLVYFGACTTYYSDVNDPSSAYIECDYTRLAVAWLIYGVSLILAIYLLILLTRGRRNFRRVFNIRSTCGRDDDGRCGDFCCVGFCTCCAIIQMLRHSHDEKEFPYQCCTQTGLPPNAPEVV